MTPEQHIRYERIKAAGFLIDTRDPVRPVLHMGLAGHHFDSIDAALTAAESLSIAQVEAISTDVERECTTE